MRNQRLTNISMSILKFSSIVFVLMSLVSGCSSSVWPPQPKANFGFVFEFGCVADKLNTFKGEFTQNRGGVEPDITIPLKLTNEQMLTIYRKMIAIDLSSYPEVFKEALPPDKVFAMYSIVTYYDLYVRNGETISTIHWEDNIVPPTMLMADNLRDLFNLIEGMVRQHPDFQKLPQLNFGCA